jgi:Taurine catabolism dioxygenase TauD, TfdA family
MNAPSVVFAIAPLTPAIGGLVTGIDLARPISDAVISRLKTAVAERHVLFFEGQTLDPASQRAFAARFGKLHVHPVYPNVDGVPEITLIETRPGDLPDNDNWHTDVTFIETPPFGAVLTPRTLPSSGGDTLWGSNVAAYEALSAPLRSLLDGLTAEHSFETGFPRRRWGVGAQREMGEGSRRQSASRSSCRAHNRGRTARAFRQLRFYLAHPRTGRERKRCAARLPLRASRQARVHGALALEAWRRGLLGQPPQHSLRNARLPPRGPRDASRGHPRRPAGLGSLPLRRSSLRPSRRSIEGEKQ